ncbi:MAG TPA: rhodanese-like domain-containing protein [Herpetosiphonaceae bacterium]
MLLRHIYHQPLAQASYLVGCAATGEALVVDPNRDIDHYLALAAREGLRITAVTETHIHADFVSGARELAARTGAQVYLSDEGPAAWKYAWAADARATLLHDGDHFMVGNVRVEALHTPGHTPEHLSFLVTDTAGANEPMGIFSGDVVFVGDVGRPDLLEKAAGVAGSTDQAARQLFRSLQRFRDLPAYLQVWPGHGAGSACGRALGAVPQSTVGYETRFNWAFAIHDEDAFVQAVLQDQPAPPRYFAQMKRVNKLGPPLTTDLPPVELLALAQLAGELALGTVIVDTRPAEQFAAGHIPGTLNLATDADVLTWAGWLLPFDQPFALIAEPQIVAETVALLRMIGLDTIAGFWTPAALTAWAADHGPLATIARAAPERVRPLIDRGAVTMVDVRTPQEYRGGHIRGSRNIPLSDLPARLDEIPSDQPVVVQCQSGVRSAIAASLLAGRGTTQVIDLVGGLSAWLATDQPATTTDRTPAAASVAVSGAA